MQAVLKKSPRNAPVGIIIGEAFLSRLSFGIITFALPFLALALGMSYTEIGILATLRLVAATALRPLVALIVNRLGTGRLYLAALLLRTLVALLFAFASAPWMLYGIRLLHGLSTALRDPTAAILITETGESARMARSFAWYATAREGGAMLGYLIAGIGLTWTGDDYRLIFLVSTLLSLTSLLLVALRFPRPAGGPPVADKAVQTAEAPAGQGWRHLALWGLLVTLGATLVTGLFPIIATEYGGLSKAEISLILTGSTLLTLFGTPLFGWVADRYSRRMVAGIRAGTSIGSSLILWLFPHFFGILGGRLTDDAGKAAFRPAWGALIADFTTPYTPQQRRNFITYLDTAQSTGEALGPVLAGLLWDNLGIYWLLAFRVLLGIGAELYAYRFIGAPRGQEEQIPLLTEPVSGLLLSDEQMATQGTGADGWLSAFVNASALHRLPPACLHRLAERMEAIAFREGEVVVWQNDPSDFYYLIREGGCRLLHNDVEVGTLGPLDAFGEEALVAGNSRNATVVMISDGLLMRIGREDVEEILLRPMVKRISLEEVRSLALKGAILIDVRSRREYRQRRLVRSINIPLFLLRAKLRKLIPARPYILYCDDGSRSLIATFLLILAGYEAYLLDNPQTAFKVLAARD
ncbi:MAG: MFS transporter [Gammaproteobacteria bacterium]|nr:MFS transporter [Gammaproteobacteria bacterium]MBU1653484.1 MFS transporter [Gammaproteobacteria bacterium]MBU1962725.1 MFS transporter [Gammaproteobacteria bacterium]